MSKAQWLGIYKVHRVIIMSLLDYVCISFTLNFIFVEFHARNYLLLFIKNYYIKILFVNFIKIDQIWSNWFQLRLNYLNLIKIVLTWSKSLIMVATMTIIVTACSNYGPSYYNMDSSRYNHNKSIPTWSKLQQMKHCYIKIFFINLSIA